MAITVTVSSILINVTSTGGVEETFDAVVTAANAVSAGVITGTGTSGDPYIVTGDREVQFTTGVKVRFVEDTNVKWNSITTTGRFGLDFQTGSEIEIEAGCVFDVSASSAANIYNQFSGKINVTGTSVKYVTFTGMSRNYMYLQTADVEWQYFKITENRQQGGYSIYLIYYSYSIYEVHFHHFELTSTASKGIGISDAGAGGDFSNWIITDFVMDGLYQNIGLVRSTIKLKDGELKNAYYYGGQIYATGPTLRTEYHPINVSEYYKMSTFQPMVVFENVYILDNSNSQTTKYQFLIYYGGRVLFKNCTFERSALASMVGYYCAHSNVILEEGNTFTNLTTNRSWGTGGITLHGYTIGITVIDEASSPIENATVTILEENGREKWTGLTDSNGELLNMFGDKPFLIEQEQYGASSYGDWGTHKIIVSKEGYKTEVVDFECTQAEDFEITLVEEELAQPILQIDAEIL